MRRAPILVLAALAAAGCGSKGAVSLSASIENAQLQVASVALGTKLGGSFDLRLELGDRADKAIDVTPDKFSVLGADDSTLVPTLSAATTEAYPIHVGVGQSRALSFTIDDKNPLDAAAETALCASQVRISGSVTEASSGTSTPAGGALFQVTGCP